MKASSAAAPWSSYDEAQFPERLTLGQSEYDWIAVQVAGSPLRGRVRRFAFLVWLSRTGPRVSLAGTGDDSPLGALAALLSPLQIATDRRPYFLFALYDLDDPAALPQVVETEIEEADFDRRTFSARSNDGRLELRQSERAGRFHATLRAETTAVAVELDLRAVKPMLTFGKDDSPNVNQGPIATAYAHRPRLEATGRLTYKSGTRKSYTLHGDACQDRQWLQLRPILVKWIWLQIRFDDGRELVGYVMRSTRSDMEGTNDGEPVGAEGWLIERDGSKRSLPTLTIRSIVTYEVASAERGFCPTRFTVEVPELDGLHLTLEHSLKAPYIPLKAFGALLDGGMWTGPADIIEGTTKVTGRAWVDVMNTSTTRLSLDGMRSG